jgi:hypothetical protein
MLDNLQGRIGLPITHHLISMLKSILNILVLVVVYIDIHIRHFATR